MGDAADDAFDRGMEQQMDVWLLAEGVRKTCPKPAPKPCQIIRTEYEDGDENWLPFMCAVCGEKFDL